ncbi:MAG: sigma-70 family RNA polymerase sigma factor [Blastochloris sp.]|nr:sigma-70 family RNA polymerase sigma factor [Blastochloris sp.]
MCDFTELLAALQRGEESAWDQAFHLLYPHLYHAAHHPQIQLSPNEAEDVAIETLTDLVGLVTTLHSWNDVIALGRSMASRRAISLQRRLRAHKRGGGQIQSLQQLQEDLGDSFEVAEKKSHGLSPVDQNELQLMLHHALNELPPPQPELIRDFVLQGYSYKELASKYKMPMGSIGVQLSRGLKKSAQAWKTTPDV